MNDGKPIIGSAKKKIWLTFTTQTETDMYSGAKIHVIKFTEGIDYVS